jgi:hypothetical protein
MMSKGMQCRCLQSLNSDVSEILSQDYASPLCSERLRWRFLCHQLCATAPSMSVGKVLLRNHKVSAVLFLPGFRIGISQAADVCQKWVNNSRRLDASSLSQL